MAQLEISKLIEHAPHLACVVVVVLAFLSHLKGQSIAARQERELQSTENQRERTARDVIFKETLEVRDRIFADTVTAIHKDNMEQRILLREALKETSKAMTENTLATGRLSDRMNEARYPSIQT